MCWGRQLNLTPFWKSVLSSKLRIQKDEEDYKKGISLHRGSCWSSFFGTTVEMLVEWNHHNI